MYTVEEFISAFTPGHQGFIGILIAFAIANSIGLIQYIYLGCKNYAE